MESGVFSQRQLSSVYVQIMDELDLSRFRYGGVNITGFRLVDPDSPAVREARREMHLFNRTVWRNPHFTGLKVQLELFEAEYRETCLILKLDYQQLASICVLTCVNVVDGFVGQGCVVGNRCALATESRQHFLDTQFG